MGEEHILRRSTMGMSARGALEVGFAFGQVRDIADVSHHTCRDFLTCSWALDRNKKIHGGPILFAETVGGIDGDRRSKEIRPRRPLREGQCVPELCTGSRDRI